MAPMNEAGKSETAASLSELTRRYAGIEIESDPFKRVEAVNSLFHDMDRSHPELVRRYLLSTLDLARKLDFRSGLALTLSNLGWSHLDTDDYAQARTYLLESLELWRDLKNDEGVLRCLNGLGACYMDMGLFERAIVHFRDALRYAESAEKLGHYGIILINLAKCFIDLEQYDQALHCLEQVVESSEMDPLNRAIRYHRTGIAYRNKGMLDLASIRLEKAIGLAGSHVSLLIQCQTEQALVLLAQDKYIEAEKLVTACIAKIDTSTDRRISAETMLCYGSVEEALGKPKEAEQHFQNALQQSRELGAGVLEVRSCRALSALFRNQQDFKKALEYAEACRDQERRMARESNNVLALSMEEERKLSESQLFRDQHEQMIAVGELGKLLTGSLQLEEILETVYQKLQRLVPADTFLVGLHDPTRNELVMELGIQNGLRMPEFRIDLENGGLAAWSFRNKLHVLVKNMAESTVDHVPAIPTAQEKESNSIIYMPLVRGDRTIGIVSVQSYEPDVYSNHHVNTLSALGSYLAIAMENAALFARLQILATEDSLTGFSNRRRLSEVADEEFRRSERYGNPLCVLIMDLDHFKEINDNFGHEAGDLVLRHTGELIRGMMRDVDVAFRFGGEEFVFVLPNTDIAGGTLLAERIREAQFNLAFTFTTNSTEHVHVSASIGVAERTPGDKDFDAILFRADKALYRAKNSGRNSVAVSG